MADGFEVQPVPGSGYRVATDEVTIGGVPMHVQRFKPGTGVDGSYVDVSASNPMPVTPTTAQSTVVTATIASSASLSAAVDLGTDRLFAIQMPSAWSPAANLTFQTSADGTTYTDYLSQEGVEITANAGASRSIQLNVSDWLGWRYIKIRSGTTGNAVNQSASRSIKLICLP